MDSKIEGQKVTKKLEMRSIPKREFQKYLNKIGEVMGDNHYKGEYWEVMLSEEYFVSLGRFSLVAVDILITAENERLEEFLFTFRKNFLRGGG